MLLLISTVQKQKIGPKRKFSAGCPCAHPAKNFGQALQILEKKQAFRHGHAARTSTKNFGLKNIGLFCFLFPNRERSSWGSRQATYGEVQGNSGYTPREVPEGLGKIVSNHGSLAIRDIGSESNRERLKKPILKVKNSDALTGIRTVFVGRSQAGAGRAQVQTQARVWWCPQRRLQTCRPFYFGLTIRIV